MTEQPTQAPDTDASYMSRANYASYKNSVNRAERRKAWLSDQSFRGVLKRAITKVGDDMLAVPSEHISARLNSDLGAPNEALRESSEYLNQNEGLVRQDAVHDFYNDPANSGKELNLAENSLPVTDLNDLAPHTP